MEQGLTQLALAELPGVTNDAISAMESGRRRIHVEDLVALAAALEVEPAALLP